jgi:hypothetical protein
MTRDRSRLLEHLALKNENSLAASIALKEDFNGNGAVVSYLKKKRR